MKKAVFNKRGTRQIVRTGYDVFDKQTNCIITGNAICNTQVSSFIRPYSQQECNGMTFLQEQHQEVQHERDVVKTEQVHRLGHLTTCILHFAVQDAQ